MNQSLHKKGVVVSLIRVAVAFDMTHKTLKNLGGFGVGVVVSGANLDARPVLALVVSDLTDELRQAIDRQAWARIKLTTLADFSRPLFAGIKLNVINPVLPVFCFRLYGLGESLFASSISFSSVMRKGSSYGKARHHDGRC